MKTLKSFTAIMFIGSFYLSINSYSQTVSAFSFEKTFPNVVYYDYDLNKSTGGARDINTFISLNMDENGKGRIIIYLIEKKIFNVKHTEYLENTSNIIVFTCSTSSGKEVAIYVKREYNGYNKYYIPWVKIDNDNDNTAMIFQD